MRSCFFYLTLYFTFVFLTSSCFRIKPSNGGGQVEEIKPRKTDPADIVLQEGYKIEVVSEGLTFPTGITFDENGIPYVVEAGYSYGEVWTEPRLLKINPDGTTETLATGDDNGPWNGVYYEDGFFYIAEGGELKGGKIIKISKTGEKTILIDNLPSLGDHHTNGPVVKDGYVYFGQGTATNSAVVGTDNYHYGWLKRHRGFHDIPCKDIVLNGVNFVSKNPFTENEDDKAVTGAFHPFGQPSKENDTIQGKIPCSGAIFRIPLTGGQPELIAWGLRNPYSLVFSADGKLYVNENAFDVRGNRPIWGAGDVLWEIQEGAWYGWPDYSAGRPVFGREEFTPPGCDHPVKLLKENPSTPPKPVTEYGVHSSSNGMDIIRNKAFGNEGEILVAQFGDMAPTVGKTWLPVGFRVVSVNPQTGVIKEFAANKSKINGPASWVKNNGLERPLAVRFNPDGTELYIVDFGVLVESEENGSQPVKNSGVIWKISRGK